MNIDVVRVAHIDNSTSAYSSERRQALSVTALIIVFFGTWLGLEAPRGTMWGTDELLTAERSREMLTTAEPWVVHYNFDRSFEKPPLQYWLTSFTLPRFHNRAVAVRIWPLIYGILTAIVLSWLVRTIAPEEPWLVPLSIAFLLSAPLFAPESARGLLDIGLAFFTTLTILFAEFARKNPWWWLGTAIACWLGGLQKLPAPFLILVLIILERLTNRDGRAELRSGVGLLVGSLLIGIALMSIWPLLQLFKYDMPAASVFHQEVVVWLGPTELGRRPYFEIPISMSVHPGGLCGFLSLIALFVVLFSRKKFSNQAIREIALVSFAFLVVAIVFELRHIRYAIPIVPCLCFLLATVFYRFLRQSSPVRIWTVVGLVVVIAANLVHSKIIIDSRRRDVADEKLIAEKLGELQQERTGIVLVKAINPGNDLLWDSFYLFHGNLRFPIQKLSVDQIRSNPPKAPVVGACIARDFSTVQALYPNVQVELSRAQFICWRVPQS